MLTDSTAGREFTAAFGPPHQIGMVVPDLERAVEKYSVLFGSFEQRLLLEFDDMIYRGRQVSGKLSIAFAYSGNTEIELIEVVEGQTIHSEFLAEGRSGLHHLCFKVDNFAAGIARAEELGYLPVCGQSLATADYQYLEHRSDRSRLLLELLTLYQEDHDRELE